MVRRLRRLREPRYLLGGIVGATYFYFAVFARLFGSRTRAVRRGRGTTEPEDLALSALYASGPALGGLAIFGITAVCWILPLDASILAFSDAEVQFLFPAPLTRRDLLIHRLMRSQLGLLFAALVPALLYPAASMWMRTRTALAMWVLLVTGKVYFTGVAMARANVRSTDRAARRAAWTPIVLLVIAAAVVGQAAAAMFRAAPAVDGLDVVGRLSALTMSGFARVVLWPFVALARPLFAASGITFAESLPFAVAVLGVTIAWVLRSDEAFQMDLSQVAARQQEPRAASGPTLRAASWRLPSSGRAEALFLWKNAMQTLRNTNLILALRYIGPLAWLAVVVVTIRMSSTDARGLAAGFGTFAVFVALFSVLFGPQMVRADLRSDLRHLELIKTWPVKSSEVIRGEMLWPCVVVTAFAWFALASATAFSAAALPGWPAAWRFSTAVAALRLRQVSWS